MSNNPNMLNYEFGEAASQFQGGRPIFDFSSNSESIEDSSCSQPVNLKHYSVMKQLESSKNSSDLFEALQRPLLTLSQSQEVLMAQLRLLSQKEKVADIQLNQNSSLMNLSSSTATREFVNSSSVSPKKALFPAVDTRAQELHARVFQIISSSIKPAYHKNTALNNNACFEDGTLEYIPKVNTDIPLSLATSNIPPGHSSFAQSLLSSSVSSSQLTNTQPLESQRVSTDHICVLLLLPLMVR
jgi:hypothetical protein